MRPQLAKREHPNEAKSVGRGPVVPPVLKDEQESIDRESD